MKVQALEDKPGLPWYYDVLIDHFYTLSFSRSGGPNGPNSIDIPSILSYNNSVTEMKPSDFIYIIQSLDKLYLESFVEKQTKKRQLVSTKGKR